MLNDRTAFFVGVREYFVLDNVDDRKNPPNVFFSSTIRNFKLHKKEENH